MTKYIFIFLLLYPLVAQEKKKEEESNEVKIKNEVERLLKRVSSENVVKLSMELLEREKKVKIEEEALVMEKDRIEKMKKDILEGTENIKEIQKKVIGCFNENQESFDKRVGHIVSIITNMKPIQAAKILSVQEAELSVRIMGMIESEKASKIFNLMDEEISARIQKMYIDMEK